MLSPLQKRYIQEINRFATSSTHFDALTDKQREIEYLKLFQNIAGLSKQLYEEKLPSYFNPITNITMHVCQFTCERCKRAYDIEADIPFMSPFKEDGSFDANRLPQTIRAFYCPNCGGRWNIDGELRSIYLEVRNG